MKTTTRIAVAASTALLCLLAAGCEPAGDARPGADADATGTNAATSYIGRKAAEAVEEAGRKLKTENLRVGEGTHININGRSYGSRPAPDGLPRAEITPEGELLVDGEALPATAEQRRLVLEHRRQLEGIALAGMAIGAQGADVAGTALTGIGQALFGGDEGRKAYEARVEAEAEKIKQEAYRLCTLLPGLYESQQALAAAMPGFAPYATMTPSDVDDCRKGIEDDGDEDAADAAGDTVRA